MSKFDPKVQEQRSRSKEVASELASGVGSTAKAEDVSEVEQEESSPVPQWGGAFRLNIRQLRRYAMLFRSTAYPGLRAQSIAREYPGSITRVVMGREDMLYIRVQNRDNNNVFFWHGDLPAGPTGQGGYVLPEDPAEWTAQETTDAEALLSNFGERIAPGEIWEPRIAQTGRVYALGAGSAPNRSHVVIGFMADQEQGKGSHSENGT